MGHCERTAEDIGRGLGVAEIQKVGYTQFNGVAPRGEGMVKTRPGDPAPFGVRYRSDFNSTKQRVEVKEGRPASEPLIP